MPDRRTLEAVAHPPTLFTREDYMRLPESFPAELIRGELKKMPSPTRRHQQIVRRLVALCLGLLDEERLYFAPMDVFVDDLNVLQPDVLVLDDPSQGDAKQVPLPMLVVEVLSPSTAARDRRVKTEIYLEAGVREVWLVDVEAGAVAVRTRDRAHEHAGDDPARSSVVPGLEIVPAALLRP